MTSDSGTLPVVELLGVDMAILTNAEKTMGAPVVILTLRPEPHRSWRSVSLPVSMEQAARLRDDLNRLLEQLDLAKQLT